jgi:excisionase family DNA binding protein
MTPLDFGITKAAYSRKETAEKISCGLSTVDELVADGRLKSVKLGKGRNAKRLILGPSIAQLLTEGLTNAGATA